MSGLPINPKPLTDEERAIYEWQTWVPDLGLLGLGGPRGGPVHISGGGGVGSVVAYELAAAGVGRLVLAHAGDVKPSDLNRQLLMTHEQLGKPRIESAERRLHDLNPRLEIVPVAENVSEENVERLVKEADVVVDCAPLFEERFLMNREAVRQSKPMVECAMYELQAQLTTILPGETPCLACLFPEAPPAWRREFPVFGAVSGAVGCLAAMEAVKLIAGIGESLAGELLTMDLRTMVFRKHRVSRRAGCAVCDA